MSRNIKIFTSYHKECELFESEIVKPIQVGTAINGEILASTLHDNTGDNISEKNRSYCELTAQYWAWKNIDTDYYGFMHYRRYFSFNPIQLEEDMWGNINIENINQKAYDKLHLNDNVIRKYVDNADIITTQGQDILGFNQGKTVYEHYRLSPYHRIEDLDLVVKIIEEKYPEFIQSTHDYLNSHTAYFCNMYILRKDIFIEYSEWLFDILQEHEKRQNFDDYSIDEFRVSGFLAERLWGIFYTYLKKTRNYRCIELQRSFFINTNSVNEIKPKYEENNIPIVFAADDNYIPYLAVTIRSIVENASKNFNYDIIVLNSNIQSQNKDALLKEIELEKNFSIRFFDVSKIFKQEDLHVYGHFTVEIYYRLLMQSIMEKYEKVIYLDSDLIVLSDISELYNIDIADYLVAAVQDVDSAGCYNGADKNRKEYFKKYMRMDNPYNYFNSGVLVMNLNKFRKSFTEDEIINMASMQKWLFPDQDVLNLLCENNVYYLDESWNVMINWKNETGSREKTTRCAPYLIYLKYLQAKKHPKIIHYAGFQKPWNEYRCDGAEYFWKYARETVLYEELLARLQKKMMSVYSEETAKNIVNDNDVHALHIAGVEETVYVDGLFVKMINKINKKFPKNSRKRELIKKVAKIFVK